MPASPKCSWTRLIASRSRKRNFSSQVPPGALGFQQHGLFLDDGTDEGLDAIDPVHPIEPLVTEIGHQLEALDARILVEYRLESVLVRATHPHERHDAIGILCDDALEPEGDVLERFGGLPERELAGRDDGFDDSSHSRGLL
jgi:hypothetical protein